MNATTGWARLLAPQNLTLIDQTTLRQRFVVAFGVFGIVAAIIGLLTTLTSAAPLPAPLSQTAVVAALALGGFNALWIALALARAVNVALAGMLAMYLFGFITLPGADLLLGLIAVLLATVVASLPWFVFTLVVVLGTYALNLVRSLTEPGGGLFDLQQFALPLVALAVIGIPLRFYLAAVRQSSEKAARINQRLQVALDLERQMQAATTTQALLDQTMLSIRREYDVDFAQVLLADDSGQTLLQVASSAQHVGAVGAGTQIDVSANTAYTQVMLSGIPMRLDPGRPPGTLATAGALIAPGMRAQYLLPLRDGDRVVGVLDVQDALASAFDDIESWLVLDVLAALMTAAVRSSRLQEQTHELAAHNRALREQAEAAQRDLERLNVERTRGAWQEFLSSLGPAGENVAVTVLPDATVSDGAWTDSQLRAIQERRTIQRRDGDQPVVAVPLMLRGEVIGAIEVEPGEAAELHSAVDLVEQVAERLAVGVENARLFNQAQVASTAEARINEISARFQASTSVDELLRVAMSELGQMLGAKQSAVRLGVFTLPDAEAAVPEGDER